MHSEYLQHHGVKGMKWGVRRYQNPDGTLTAVGRKRLGYSNSISDKAKKLIDTDMDRSKFQELSMKESEALWKARSKGTDKYNDEVKKWNERRKNLYQKHNEEMNKLRDDVFSDPSIKEDVDHLKDLKKQMDTVEHETISFNSPLADKAYKKYLKDNKNSDNRDDLEYGFYHYIWGEGNKDYDDAYKVYEQKVGKIQKDYWNGVRSIGERICDGMKDLDEYSYTRYKSDIESQLNNYYFGNTLYRK